MHVLPQLPQQLVDSHPIAQLVLLNSHQVVHHTVTAQLLVLAITKHLQEQFLLTLLLLNAIKLVPLAMLPVAVLAIPAQLTTKLILALVTLSVPQLLENAAQNHALPATLNLPVLLTHLATPVQLDMVP